MRARMLEEMGMEMARLGEFRRKLEPLEAKTLRLRYGLGCQRQHTVEEIAEAFQSSAAEVVRILETARHRRTGLGLDADQLRAVASCEECDFPTPFAARSARLVRLIENPPPLRRQGFQMWAADTSK